MNEILTFVHVVLQQQVGDVETIIYFVYERQRSIVLIKAISDPHLSAVNMKVFLVNLLYGDE